MDLITVKTYNTRLEAQVDKGYLMSKGIQSNIVADDAGGIYTFPLQITTTGVQLKVYRNDFEKAKKLLSKNSASNC